MLGVVLIALATGLTDFLLSQIPDDPEIKKYLNEPLILEKVPVSGLVDIPVIGPALFNQTILVYIMYGSVVFVTLLLFQTTWGLRVRSVGEHPKAADTVGINVNRIRWQAVLLGGVFAGLGGAFFTVGSTGTFDSNASAGNGFIALAAVIMGRWHPVGATLASLLFGFCFTLQAQLAFLDKIPGELLRASPYLVTVIAVAGLRRTGASAGGRRRALREVMTAEPDDEFDWEALRAQAVEAMGHAYAPYSHFPVGRCRRGRRRPGGDAAATSRTPPTA